MRSKVAGRAHRAPIRVWLACALLLVAPPLRAGGGPLTTLLVVNGDSPLSLTVANAYVALREIPASNVLWLHGVPSRGAVDVDTFRDRIWAPIITFLQRQDLADVVETIVYSADFPYAVDFKPDLDERGQRRDKHRGHVGSLTGLTYFARQVEARSTDYAALDSNRYFGRAHTTMLRPPRGPSTMELELQARAEKAYQRKRYEEAAELYAAITRTYPWSPAIWFRLASSLGGVGKPEAALEALTRAVERGWANSLAVRNDPHLAALRSRPELAGLTERMDAAIGTFEPALGFERYLERARTPRERYYLSVLLGYAGPRGNGLPEILDYLASAAASDGTRPDGTVYLLENNNIRSVVRQPFFRATAEALEARGRRAEILTGGEDGQRGILPRRKDDVIGVVAGTDRFRWDRSRSHMLPGAIAESLTSYGGHFGKRMQTKLSEFLRHGAAGSSGTVAEPYSFYQKFPVPFLHVHYADGCSLAESFYRSVAAPYQLLIVGDPLARPFARFAEVALATPDPARAWRGVVEIRAALEPAPGRPLERIELWVDGRRLATAPAGEPLRWDTTTVEDGSHELRLVAVEAGAVATRSYARSAVRIDNHGRSVTLRALGAVRLGDSLRLAGHAPGARRVSVLQGTRVLAVAPVEGDRFALEAPTEPLGVGRVTLHARAHHDDGVAARSAPLAIDIEPPQERAALAREPPGAPGLRALVRDVRGREREITVRTLAGRLDKLVGGGPTPAGVLLSGWFEARESGLHQLVVAGSGHVRLALGGAPVLDAELGPERPEAFVALNLEAGWHRLELALSPGERPALEVLLTGQGVATPLAAARLRTGV